MAYVNFRFLTFLILMYMFCKSGTFRVDRHMYEQSSLHSSFSVNAHGNISTKNTIKDSTSLDASFSAKAFNAFYRKSKTAAYLRENQARLIKLSQQSFKEGFRDFLSPFNPLNPLVDCTLCGLVVEESRILINNGHSMVEFEQFVTTVCIDAHIQDKDVCTTVVQTFKDEVIGAFLEVTMVPMELCGFLLSKDCGVPFNPVAMWNVTLPQTLKPPVVPPTPPAAGSPRLRVLHLTDMHFDPEYVAGANAECPELLCCRRRDGPPAPGGVGAGKYGDYRHCDSPKLTLEKLFEHLAAIQDQFDYVMFTGDLPPHNVWNQTKQDQLTSLEAYTNYMLKYLPNKQIFNALGNHESAPMGNFPPPYVRSNDSVDWLYEATNSSWRHWLPQKTEPTILRAGFYSYSPFPGLKIISINSNLCYNFNFWLYVNNTDPAGMLQWLISELQESEDKEQKVHILGHVYPGCSCCLRAWSWNYNKIVNRYESTITGQFFGHTHNMIYEVFYDVINRTRPVGVAYIPGSVTTYSFLNPGFRIYEVDGNYEGSSWEILDFTNYFLNITEANWNAEPQWQKEYTAKSAYGMKSVYTEDWNDLIYRMNKDDTLFKQFCSHTHKSAPSKCSTCTGDCKKKVLCNLKTARSEDPDICADL